MGPAHRRFLVQNRLSLLAQDGVRENGARNFYLFLRLGGGFGRRGLQGVQLVSGGGGIEIFRLRLFFRAVGYRAGHAGIVGVVIPSRSHHAVAGLAVLVGQLRGGRGRLRVVGILGAQGAGSGIHRRGRQIQLRLSRRLGRLLIFQWLRGVLLGVVLGLLQFCNHLCQEIHQFGTLLLHGVDTALQILQAQAVGVLNFAGLLGSGLHHLAGLTDGLLPGQLVDSLGFQVGVLQQLVGFLPGLAADAGGFFLRSGHHGIPLGQHLLFGLVMLPPFDAQGGIGVLGPLGQLFIFQFQIGVFQAQHRHLVSQRVVALLHFGVARLHIALHPGNAVGLARQRGILRGQILVLANERLAAAAQSLSLLLGAAHLLGSGVQPLFVIAAQVQHGLAHVVRLVSAKPRLAHAALLDVLVNVDGSHRDPPQPQTYVYLFNIIKHNAPCGKQIRQNIVSSYA